MKMKKYFSMLVLFVIVSSLMVPVFAAQSILFKFVYNAVEGTYGYDLETPVRLHNFTTEEVMIPDDFIDNKYQFRSAWVATIHNLHIRNTTSKEEFQGEYNKILDTYEDWNMNAMIFQIRPLLDAFYPSQFNPWSEFATGQLVGNSVVGQQGVDPGWDPLSWMVEETHKRGLEYHAWFNPYRVTNTRYGTVSWLARLGMSVEEVDALSNKELVLALNKVGILADNNYAVLNPEHVQRFDQKLFLDPAVPEVRQHVVDTIVEVIENYDVDAIHFDDYFYPYASNNRYFGELGEDRESFELYGLPNGYADTVEGIEAWRRDNVTALISDVGNAITAENQKNNRAIQFGISPFGIWEHNANDARGSFTPTGSSQTYSRSVFADTYKWVQEEMIDYISPQIYWSFDQGAAPYGELTRWWSSVVEDKNVDLYIGHANYKHIQNGAWEDAWMNPEEIVNQLKYNQLYPQVNGSIFFSYNDIVTSDLSLYPGNEAVHQAKNQSINLLKEHYQQYHTVIPSKPWLNDTAPIAPMEVSKVNDNQITWKDSVDNISRYYLVYRVHTPNGETIAIENVISNPRNIVARVWRDGETHYFEDNIENPEEYTYIITAFDAAHNESTPVIAREETIIAPSPETEFEPTPILVPKPEPNDILNPEPVTPIHVNTPNTAYGDHAVLFVTLFGISVMILYLMKKSYKKVNK